MIRFIQRFGALGLGIHAIGAWYFGDQIRNGALLPVPPPEPDYQFKVLSVDEHTITLSSETDDGGDAAGIHGVRWPLGHGIVGEVLSKNNSSVVRNFKLGGGSLLPGTLVDLDGVVYRGDPFTALGLAFDIISFEGSLGSLSAWHIPADGHNWVIFVHGKSGPLDESLRTVRALHDADLHVLVVSYRNDVGMPVDSSGYYRQGATEWEDLDAAVTYAKAQGAVQIALFGCSMGGAIAASFLQQSDQASDVAAVLLDSPMLDFKEAVLHQVRTMSVMGLGIPQSLISVACALTALRFGVDWDRLDYTNEANDYKTPMLIFHGADDDAVPVGPSRRLATLRPDLVELIEPTGAGHVLSWNVDPTAYETRVIEFLQAAMKS